MTAMIVYLPSGGRAKDHRRRICRPRLDRAAAATTAGGAVASASAANSSSGGAADGAEAAS
jgi:hypothetical protein